MNSWIAIPSTRSSTTISVMLLFSLRSDRQYPTRLAPKPCAPRPLPTLMPRGKRARPKTTTRDYDAGCPVKSISTRWEILKELGKDVNGSWKGSFGGAVDRPPDPSVYCMSSSKRLDRSNHPESKILTPVELRGSIPYYPLLCAL